MTDYTQQAAPTIAANKMLAAALAMTDDDGNEIYRLAVQCDRCGRWVTHPDSVRRHMGPRCAGQRNDA